MRLLRLTAIGLAMGLLGATGALAWTVPPGSGHYSGPGVVVTAFNLGGGQITVADNGAVVCEDTDADGIPDHGVGGVCLPWTHLAGDSVALWDLQQGPNVAFQVCVDANGDGVCGGGGQAKGGLPIGGGCGDIIVFSHDTFTGAFHNPLWIPSWAYAHWASCGSLGFAGVIVMTCAGVHSDRNGLNAHTHEVSEGFVTGVSTGGTPTGDFCGAPTAAKAYVVR